MSSLAQKVSSEIFDAIESDDLVLPTMPEMALRVREIAEDPDAAISQLGEVIGSDAGLTARIIKVSNSALYRGAMEIENLNMALMRLGMATTCTLATGLAMQQMFQATTDIVDAKLRQVWNESSQIAAISAAYCKHYTKLRTDQATLAGLTHAIGVLPILSYAEDNPSLLSDGNTLNTIIKSIQANIGEKILSAWDFPKEIRHVPAHCLEFTREESTVDYADLVTAAILKARAEEYINIDLESVTAFPRIGMDPTQENNNDLNNDISSSMGTLS